MLDRVGLIRNVPILVLALFAFFALPQYGIRFSNTNTFAAVLAVYAGAYLTESFRAAILIIPKGTIEAARSIGLTGTGIALWVVLPIAFRNALPSLGNNFISLFKDTSLVYIVGMKDLLEAVKTKNDMLEWASASQSITGYAFAAIVFWTFCFSMSRYSMWVERRLDTGYKR